MVAEARVAELVREWQEADRASAVSESDRRGVERTESARSLVVEGAITVAPLHEWFTAWLRYGRLLAEEDATTALVEATVGSLEALLPGMRALPSARAALLEGYMTVVVERERKAADLAWSAERCIVDTGDATAAVCLPPFGDTERLAPWALEVARILARKGVRRIFCDGGGPAKSELDAALRVPGITFGERRDGPEVPERASAEPPARRGFWPFR